MSSNWINFVKNYSRKHNIPYSKALREAKIPYNRLKLSGGGPLTNNIDDDIPTAEAEEIIPTRGIPMIDPEPNRSREIIDYPLNRIDSNLYEEFKAYLEDVYDLTGRYGDFTDMIDPLIDIMERIDENSVITGDELELVENAMGIYDRFLRNGY